MSETRKPGERIAKWIHKNNTVLLPHHNGQPGQHESYIAVSEPYEFGGEWWVDVLEPGDRDGEPFAIALWEASLPI